jgi:hypothetical protein
VHRCLLVRRRCVGRQPRRTHLSCCVTHLIASVCYTCHYRVSGYVAVGMVVVEAASTPPAPAVTTMMCVAAGVATSVSAEGKTTSHPAITPSAAR